MGIYGVVLTLMGLFADHHEKTKADDVNINLWAGLVMLATAIAFGVWARVRPIIVPDHVETDEEATIARRRTEPDHRTLHQRRAILDACPPRWPTWPLPAAGRHS